MPLKSRIGKTMSENAESMSGPAEFMSGGASSRREITASRQQRALRDQKAIFINVL
jgi:hypothetical protein